MKVAASSRHDEPLIKRARYNQVEEPLVERSKRNQAEDGPQIHYGLVASANGTMKDATTRDALAQQYDILCFDVEAAGLVDNFPCLFIKGVCDYADQHKHNTWHGYAAATAAAYAKILTMRIPHSHNKDIAASNERTTLSLVYEPIPWKGTSLEQPSTLSTDSAAAESFLNPSVERIGFTMLSTPTDGPSQKDAE